MKALISVFFKYWGRESNPYTFESIGVTYWLVYHLSCSEDYDFVN